MKPEIIVLVALSLVPPSSAAEQGRLDPSVGRSVHNLTLLPGPHFLSPPGSAPAGHHWISISSPNGELTTKPARTPPAEKPQREGLPRRSKDKPLSNALDFKQQLPALKTTLSSQ